MENRGDLRRDRFAEARYEVWSHARKMWESGLVVGASGNISARVSDDPSVIAITPTSITYDEMGFRNPPGLRDWGSRSSSSIC